MICILVSMLMTAVTDRVETGLSPCRLCYLFLDFTVPSDQTVQVYELVDMLKSIIVNFYALICWAPNTNVLHFSLCIFRLAAFATLFTRLTLICKLSLVFAKKIAVIYI